MTKLKDFKVQGRIYFYLTLEPDGVFIKSYLPEKDNNPVSEGLIWMDASNIIISIYEKNAKMLKVAKYLSENLDKVLNLEA